MNSLRDTRKQKGLTLKQIEQQIGINISLISEIERGIRLPSLLTRRRLEAMFGQRINWLDVPYLKTDSACLSEWNNAEFNFRQLYKEISGLPVDERCTFINTAIRHLKKLKNEAEIA